MPGFGFCLVGQWICVPYKIRLIRASSLGFFTKDWGQHTSSCQRNGTRTPTFKCRTIQGRKPGIL
ncbi:hypothetical protein NQ314_011242 [Rhamnusium bicolor]|uniref:Uncharacterized protein n=1 Tax=Rhamnusium bicolor TaxID=1586634 RepID=A0AAV8XKU9_9CUCU|nr:hypothetical protein NQ314_011242 [Rhamnusium bicolor]